MSGVAPQVPGVRTTLDDECRPTTALRLSAMTALPEDHGFRTSPHAHFASLSDEARLSVLRSSGLLHGAAVPSLDQLTRIASVLLDAPIALVSVVDDLSQHFPGLTGLGGWAGEQRQTPLSHSFCQHVVATGTALLVNDVSDTPLVSDNLAVPDLGVAAYAGVPLRTREGHTLGALCAVDSAPRAWNDEQIATLEELAAVAMVEIERMAVTPAPANEVAALQTIDPLTGLPNVAGFADEAKAHLAACSQHGLALGLISVELTSVAALNATAGVDAGDRQLVMTARRLERLLRRGQSVAYVGNAEFLVLLPGVDQAGGEELASRLRDTLAAAGASPDLGALTFRIGTAVWLPGELPFIAPVIKRATMARRAAAIVTHHAMGGLAA
jgi:diguanylate cyclase (GGDEF)-like protein